MTLARPFCPLDHHNFCLDGWDDCGGNLWTFVLTGTFADTQKKKLPWCVFAVLPNSTVCKKTFDAEEKKSFFFACGLQPPAEMSFKLVLSLDFLYIYKGQKMNGGKNIFRKLSQKLFIAFLRCTDEAAKPGWFGEKCSNFFPRVIGSDYRCKSEATYGNEKKNGQWKFQLCCIRNLCLSCVYFNKILQLRLICSKKQRP